MTKNLRIVLILLIFRTNFAVTAAETAPSTTVPAGPTVVPAAVATSGTSSETKEISDELKKDSINRMKDEVLNKKTQSLLLRQLIKSEGIESTFPKVVIQHLNEMGSRYKIVSLIYTMDTERIFTYYHEENSAPQVLGKVIDIFKGPLIPGKHQVVVDVIYRGNDTGVFSYINDYKIPAKGQASFQMEKGKNVLIQVKGFEKGWALTDFKERPDIAFKIDGSK